MSLETLIEGQLAAIEKARKELARKTLTAADLERPAQGLKTRIDRIDRGIAVLERQREDTMRRLDAAIAEEKALRKRLEKELEDHAGRMSDRPRTPTPSRPRKRGGTSPKRGGTSGKSDNSD